MSELRKMLYILLMEYMSKTKIWRKFERYSEHFRFSIHHLIPLNKKLQE